MTNEAKVVGVIGLVTALLIGGVAFYSIKYAPKSPSYTPVVAKTDLADAGQITREDAYFKGDENAKVTVVEFGDYQCPACASAYPTVEQIMASYAGKGVRMQFRNFPLPQHRNAQVAATAAEAAGEQGKYWEMYDKLYQNQEAWTADPTANKTVAQATTIFEGYAQDLGLDVEKFKTAVADRKFNDKISRDLADAAALNLQATPSFFVNGRQVGSVGDIAAAIDAELAK